MWCPALHRIIEACNIIVPWCSIFLWSSSLFVYATDSCAELQFSSTQVFNNTLTAEKGIQVQIPFSVRCNNSDDLIISVSRWSNTRSMYFPLCNIVRKQNGCRNSTSGNMTSNETIECFCLETDGKYLVTMNVTEKDFTKWQWSINETSGTTIWITKSGATLQFDNTQVSNNTLTADTGTQVYIPFSVKYKTHNNSDDLQITVSRWDNTTSTYFPLCKIIRKQNVCRNSTSGNMTSNDTIACVCLGTDREYLVTKTVTEQDFTKWKWSIKGGSDTFIWITKSDPTNEVATPKVMTTSNQALHGTIGILVGVFTPITVLAILVVLSKKRICTLHEVKLKQAFSNPTLDHESRTHVATAINAASEDCKGKGQGRNAGVFHAVPEGDLDVKPKPALLAPQTYGFEDTTSQALNDERRQEVNTIRIRSVQAFVRCVVDKANVDSHVSDQSFKGNAREGTVNKDGLIYTTLDLADIQSKDPSTFTNLRSTTYTVVKFVNESFPNDNKQMSTLN